MNMSTLKKGAKTVDVINAVTFGLNDVENILRGIIERHKLIDHTDSMKANGVVSLLDYFGIRGNDVVTLYRVVSKNCTMMMIAILLASEHHLAGMNPEKLMKHIRGNIVFTDKRTLLRELRKEFPKMNTDKCNYG